MLRKTLLLVALSAAPVLAAQQPTQQPAAAKPKANASQAADTAKAKSHASHKSSKKKSSNHASGAAAAPHDTTKAKP